MLARAEKEGGGARYVRGEATRTTLPRGKAQLVVAAQAFHWFDLPPTLVELRRVLAPEGGVAAMWNARGDSPLMRGYKAALREVEGYSTTPQPEDTERAIDGADGLVDRDYFEVGSQQLFDRAGLEGRARSSSYVAHATPEEKARLTQRLDALFSEHVVDGAVTFEYRTRVSFFRFDAVDVLDRIPDVRDGLDRRERAVLFVMNELKKERGDRFISTAEIYGRVVEHADMSVAELQAILIRMGARR